MQTNLKNLSREQLKGSIDGFSSARVLVIGDIMMDAYIWGEVSRISPEAPVPVVDVRQETTMLGGAANVVHNMVTLGATPLLCGVVGTDRPGRAVRKELQDLGLTTDGIKTVPDRPTSIKTRVIAHHQQVVRFDRENRTPIDAGTIRRLLRFIREKLGEVDAVLVSDYGKGVISPNLMKGLREIVSSRKGRSIRIAVDPKPENFECYRGVDAITPNHHEAGTFCRFSVRDEETLLRAGRKMIQDLDLRSVLITQGKDGMTLFERTGEVTHIPTLARKVFDVTGAGDTVIATFSLGLATGMDLKSAAVLSNLAAGLVVEEVGTSTVKAHDLKRAVDGRIP